jgi:hypothetical protein
VLKGISKDRCFLGNYGVVGFILRSFFSLNLIAFLPVHERTLRIAYFPTYSPELNPVEPCWKPARKKLSNRVILSMPAAKYHLCKVFEDETSMPKMFEYLSN